VKYPCPDPNCRKLGCTRHCNTCGQSIVWRPPNLDPEIYYKATRPLDPTTGKFHECMHDGVDEYRNMSRLYPRRKACVILCPYYHCTKAIVDNAPEHELLDEFRKHLAISHRHILKEEIGLAIYNKKEYIQRNNKIAYTDPFLFVSMEEINK
jgi:hypothetical protein